MANCPIWQCGGTMRPVERDIPLGLTDADSYAGDWQQPDLVCDNCGAIYRIMGYKKLKNLKEERKRINKEISELKMCLNE